MTPHRVLDGLTPAGWSSQVSWPLHDALTTRTLEAAAASVLPAHSLMGRAGLQVARLALALTPHARRVLIAAGPGNNGGDGFEAAVHLHAAGCDVHVLDAGDASRAPPDAAWARQRAQMAGVRIAREAPASNWHADLAIDALLGVGTTPRAPGGAIAEAVQALQRSAAPVLAIDLPTGLHPDTGARLGDVVVHATHTLSLLTLKPGLFTAHGRDLAGDVWFSHLGATPQREPATAMLAGARARHARRHDQHKGSFGDVMVIGGAPGMTGAAWLAASSSLAAGAGRVYVGLLDDEAVAHQPAQRPELMTRRAPWRDGRLDAFTVVCGCGGGEAVRHALPAVLAQAPRLVLDADGLNTIAADTVLQALLTQRAARHAGRTILTPHPLEAARLIGATDARTVQADRLGCAQALATRFGCTVVLKGSGSITAAPGHVPVVNPTGDARLATPGSGDVLAGWIGGRWAQSPELDPLDVAVAATFEHGAAVHGEGRTKGAVCRAADLIERMHDRHGLQG